MDVGTRLLPGIYGCCDDVSRWGDTLDQICLATGARSAAVQIFRTDGARLLQRWCRRDSYSSRHAVQHDAWINNKDNPRINLRVADLPLGEVITDRSHLDRADVNEIQRRLAMVGLRGGTSIMFQLSASAYFAMILHRAADDAHDADEEDAALLSQLAPHLQQAGRLAMTLHASRDRNSLVGALADRLRVGMILCTREGDLRWSNRAAERLIGRCGGLTIAGGRLRSAGPAARGDWQRLLSIGPDPSATAIAGFADDGGHEIQIMAFPASRIAEAPDAEWMADEELVSLILLDPSEPADLQADALRALFGFTGAEAAMAVALCGGVSPTGYASTKGISIGTARIHLKRILGKTDCHRQADLVRKLCGSVMAQAAPPEA